MSVNSPRGELSGGRGICKPAPRAGSEVSVWKSLVYRRHLRPWDSVKSAWGECTAHAPVPELTRAHDKTQTCITVHGAPQVLAPAAPPRLPPLALGAGPPHCPWNDLVPSQGLRVSGACVLAGSHQPTLLKRSCSKKAPDTPPTTPHRTCTWLTPWPLDLLHSPTMCRLPVPVPVAALSGRPQNLASHLTVS